MLLETTEQRECATFSRLFAESVTRTRTATSTSPVTAASKICHFSYTPQCFRQNTFCHRSAWGYLRTSSYLYKEILFPFYMLGKLLWWINLPKFTKVLSDWRWKTNFLSPYASKSNTPFSATKHNLLKWYQICSDRKEKPPGGIYRGLFIIIWD